MKKLVSLFFVIVAVSWMIPVQAQISQGGTPRSFSMHFNNMQAVQVPVIQMIEVDVDSLRAEDALIDPLRDRPWRFGENLYVDVDIKTDGILTVLPNGDKIYRISIYSPEAVSLNLTFDKYALPAGADLFIYNEDHSSVLGAFTSQNNQTDSIFATTLLHGDKVTIEYFEPENVSFPGTVHLYRVYHGYRGINEFLKDFGDAGSCNVNVACSQSAGWENEIKSVCMIFTGTGYCTGSLVNNTAEDGTPYILTANHCYSDPTSWVYTFNWQSPTCSNPATSPASDVMSGSVLRARNAASDFMLTELNSTPPASYGVYYAGWNRSTDATISGTSFGIHHPQGDIKKISWTTTTLTTTTYLQTATPGDGSHFRVTLWDDGTTTEGGSSGSALFDSNHRIVGQLHGGYAACGNTSSDWYGRFSVSWTGGGTNATRLSNWLDPLGTAPTTLDGYDPNTPAYALDAQVSTIQSPSGSACGSTSITPIVSLKNVGSSTLTSATVYYQIDSNTPVSQTWSGSLATNTTATVTFPAVTSTFGVHTIKSWSALPNGGTDANTANDSVTSSFTLLNGIINTFPWTEGFENGGLIPECWSQSYVSGSLNWSFIAGTGGGSPTTAHGGSYNANFYEGAYGTNNVTKLITPALDLAGFSTATLTFWHVQRLWSPDQDTLKVYYRTSAGGSWTLLNTYSSSVTSWTQRTITLPNLTSDYYIAFEGTEMYGYGIGVDDINVSGVAAGTIATGTIAGSPLCAGAAVSVPFTITGSFTAGNVFTAQLSDAAGSFASPVSIGTLTSTTAGTINATIPLGTLAGSAYRIRVVSSVPVTIGTANTVDIVINTVPAQPSAITGQIGPCQTTTEYYSVTPVAGVTYTWVTPADWIITAGQGTNSLTVTVGASSGTVQVTPSNTCGNGTPQTMTVTSSVLPSQPSAIVGDNTPCQNSQTYSVTTVAGVTYSWVFPAGWIITAGQGTSTVTVTPSANAGTITVTPSTGCGNGTLQALTVTPEPIAAQPSAINGNASPCAGISEIYSVTNVASITYTWAFPAGWVITAGQNTNSVTVTASSTGGTVTVTPSNTCGNGTPQTLTLTPSVAPSQPVVTGPPTPCQGTSAVYAVTGVAGETYNWSVPGDWAITAGQGSPVITVTLGATSGPVAVIPTNICGTGSAGSMTVIIETAPVQPTAITGSINPCIGSSQNYSVTNVAGVTYTWALPSGWSQTAGGTTSSITVTTGALSGSISVTPSTACGAGPAQTLTVTAQTTPVVDLGPDQTICDDDVTILDAGAGFSSYSWSTGANSQTITVDGAAIGVGAHTITSTVTNAFGCNGSNDIVVTVLDCSGINDGVLTMSTVYPNPSSESFNIAFAGEHNQVVIHLFDATGRIVFVQSSDQVVDGMIILVPVSKLNAGIYTLQIVSAEGVQMNSIIVQ